MSYLSYIEILSKKTNNKDKTLYCGTKNIKTQLINLYDEKNNITE